MGKAEIVAVEDMMALSRSQAEAELAQVKAEMEAACEEARVLGILSKIDYDQAHNEMLKYVVLMRLRDSKEYRKSGRTWAQFCEDVLGEPKRTVDERIADIRPLVDDFGRRFAQLGGLEFRQIRLLGRSIGRDAAQITDGALVIGDDRIPLDAEHKDDIEAAIEALQERQKALLAEKDATLRTKDKLLESKDDLIHRQEKDLARFEEDATAHGHTVDEAAWAKRLDIFRTTFDGVMSVLDPERNLQLRGDGPTASPRCIAAYLTTLDYLRKQILAAYACAVDWYGDPVTCPEDGWTPPEPPEPSLEL